MAIIDTIRKRIKDEEYELTIPHFFEEMADDHLTFWDIGMAIDIGVDMPDTENSLYDYGECEICDTPLQEQRIKRDFWIRGDLIVDHGSRLRSLSRRHLEG